MIAVTCSMSMPGEAVAFWTVVDVVAESLPQSIEIDLSFGDNFRKQFLQSFDVFFQDVRTGAVSFWIEGSIPGFGPLVFGISVAINLVFQSLQSVHYCIEV